MESTNTRNNTIIINNKYNNIIIKDKVVTMVKVKKYRKKDVVMIDIMSSEKYIQMMSEPMKKRT